MFIDNRALSRGRYGEKIKKILHLRTLGETTLAVFFTKRNPPLLTPPILKSPIDRSQSFLHLPILLWRGRISPIGLMAFSGVSDSSPPIYMLVITCPIFSKFPHILDGHITCTPYQFMAHPLSLSVSPISNIGFPTE